MTDPAPAATTARPLRAVGLLSAAAFVSTATVRVADPLLPQIAHDFGVTPAVASIVATSAALAYGGFQIVYGVLGDRFGKFTVIAVAILLSAISTGAAAMVGDLSLLAVLRFVSGGTAAAVIPLAIAHIGDVVPYEGRQAVLARFLSGQILGVLFGQMVGGLLADHLGWRGIFVLLGLFYLVIDTLLWLELTSGRVIDSKQRSIPWGGMPARYLAVLRIGRARKLIAIVACEGFLFFGGLTFVGSFARHDFELSYAAVGLVLGWFGVGGLVYSATVKLFVARLGERLMVIIGGGLLAAGFAGAALAQSWWALPPAVLAMGIGFYMHHATLQTNATQMAPEARGIAISLFAFMFYIGQAAGVALCGLLVEVAGYRTMFALGAPALLAMALALATVLPRRRA